MIKNTYTLILQVTYQRLPWYFLAELLKTMYILADFEDVGYLLSTISDFKLILILSFTDLTIKVSPFNMLFFNNIFEIGSSIINWIVRRKNLTPKSIL